MVSHPGGNRAAVRLTWATRRFVEQEIRWYPQLLREYLDLRNDIILAQPRRDTVVSGGEVGDPTGRKAVRLVSDRYLRRLESSLPAMEEAMRLLAEQEDGEKKCELVRLTYWTMGLGTEQIAKRLNISRRTYFYWKDQILLLVAWCLGLTSGREQG